ALMDIQTSPVQRRAVAAQVRLTGKVDFDETRLAVIAARVPGRLDRLYVDYTGIPVAKGDHLVWLYSPDLISAQQELIQSARSVREGADAASPYLRQSAQRSLQASRDKLRLWGLTAEQIAKIENLGQPEDHVTIYAPMGGVVIQKHAQAGAYVAAGAPIYSIADLTHVWVRLDAYESDLPWLRYGQDVAFTVEAWPGRQFTGRIAFIDPVVEPMTRTVKVRVNAPNPAGLLKPGMFARALVHSSLAQDGRVLDPSLAGKWVCPMHPDEIEPLPGACGQCGMALVSAESLGFVAAEHDPQPLVIPASAPLVTGSRAVVYVQTSAAPSPVFEGREVTLGPRAGDWQIVLSGLKEGDRVVTNGAFKIDSSLQIQARPSMMNPPAPPAASAAPQPPQPLAVPAGFASQLAPPWNAYLQIHAALAAGQSGPAVAAANSLSQTLSAVDASALSPPAGAAWRLVAGDLLKSARALAAADSIQAQRQAFAPLSLNLLAAFRVFGSPAPAVHVLHCPMAFNNRGAKWLQASEAVANPYFGKAMYSCGEVVETIPPQQSTPAGGANHEHNP
ncbi:MAG TPA: efflux RND transporter periplasmic adaptor subunit, partial [Candidatus Brocadiia bacterium]|nr:efflux RND transporter periplasmic adaptor subunit [Candidatus Brocadiia bacterium]